MTVVSATPSDPPFGDACLFSSAEPSWYDLLSPLQLAGQLNLSALFSPVTYLTDVHLADNPAFFASYTRQLPLYERVTQLAEAGVVRVLLRDQSGHDALSDSLAACDSFADLQRSWLDQDGNQAGLIPGSSPAKDRYIADLDRWTQQNGVLRRYSYEGVKRRFIATVQNAGPTGSPLSGLRWQLLNASISPECRTDLDRTTERDWFTLGDVYRVLKSHGIALNHDVSRAHSLANEVAYAQEVGSSIIGVSTPSPSPQAIPIGVARTPERDDNGPEGSLPALIERASHVLTGPDLAILGLLSAEELLELRVQGSRFFDSQVLVGDAGARGYETEASPHTAEEAAAYWHLICEYLAMHHPAATQRPTRLAIFVGKLPSWAQQFMGSAIRLSLDMGVATASGHVGLPPTAAKSLKAVASAQGRNGLQMLFFRDNDDMVRIRSVFPSNNWITNNPYFALTGQM